MRRRRFVRTLGTGAAGTLLLPAFARGQEARRLVLLHTNDTHSRIDPFPADGGPMSDLGGVARRASLVERIRAEEPNVLLLDSGDMVQGTAYFNLFGGEVEMRTMTELGYAMSTLGNHEFDNGVDGLVSMLEHAGFPLVCANYEIDDPRLARHVEPWRIREVDDLRIGIFGLGIDFRGLVLDHNHEGVRYTDPLAAARQAVDVLRHDEACDLVVCLSHLGHEYRGDRPSDLRLATEVPGLDIVLGGHTHTFLDAPVLHTHPDGSSTLVHQVGWGGVRLGRIDVTFEERGVVAVGGTGYTVGPRSV